MKATIHFTHDIQESQNPHIDTSSSHGQVRGWVGCNGTRKQFSTGIFCDKSEFFDGIINPKSEESRASAQELKDLKDRIKSIKILPHMTAEMVVKIVRDEYVEGMYEHTIKTALNYSLMENKQTLTQSTIDKQDYCVRKFDSFLSTKMGYKDVEIAALSPKIIISFQNNLIEEGIQYTTARDILKCLSSLYNNYIDDHVDELKSIPSNPFRISIRKLSKAITKLKARGSVSVEEMSLTEEEVRRIWEYEPVKDHYNWYKYTALWQIYTGFARADLANEFKFKKTKDGSQYIEMRRQKTGIKSVIPVSNATMIIHKELLRLASKYAQDGSDNIFPDMQVKGTTYKRFLKRMSLHVGRRLHSHLFRHTFGMTMSRKGIPLEYISKMMGHTSTKTTESFYVRPEDETVIDNVKSILG